MGFCDFLSQRRHACGRVFPVARKGCRAAGSGREDGRICGLRRRNRAVGSVLPFPMPLPMPFPMRCPCRCPAGNVRDRHRRLTACPRRRLLPPGRCHYAILIRKVLFLIRCEGKDSISVPTCHEFFLWVLSCWGTIVMTYNKRCVAVFIVFVRLVCIINFVCLQK